jgi:hypothetical protein
VEGKVRLIQLYKGKEEKEGEFISQRTVLQTISQLI